MTFTNTKEAALPRGLAAPREPALPVRTVPFCLADFERLAAIEQQSFAPGWSRAELSAALCDPVTRCYVATDYGPRSAGHGEPLGYILLGLCDETVVIDRLAVAAAFRGEGIGRALIARALKFLTPRRKHCGTLVEERNLAGQLFLRACGFVCTEIAGLPEEEDQMYFFERGGHAAITP